MCRILLTVAAVICIGTIVQGQELPKVEVFGGYSYVNIDANNLAKRQNANGFEASVSGNLSRWFCNNLRWFANLYPLFLKSCRCKFSSVPIPAVGHNP
jgi:hypothetical protein